MNIRAMVPDDLVAIKEIHEKYFKDEFLFPDFTKNFINAFVVENEGSIVAAGGIRNILESIVISNKDMSNRKRRDSLLMLLGASNFTARFAGHDVFHAFITDSNWKNQLMKYGFKVGKGENLIIGV